MNKIFGTLIVSGAVLAASTAVADIDKRSSGRDGTQCIDGGERECGIAWEGKGLFNISARASYAFTTIWEEDLDLQQAYLCCTADTTRKKVCEHSWITWDHCHDYVLKFFDPANEAKIYSQSESLSDRIGDLYNAGLQKKVFSKDEPIVYPKWIDGIRELNEDILQNNPNSASARKMRSCMDQAGDFWSNEVEFVMEQVSEVFDVITIVETGYGLGSFFVDKAIASALRDGARIELISAEKNYLIKGVEKFTEEDIQSEFMSQYLEFAEERTGRINLQKYYFDFKESITKAEKAIPDVQTDVTRNMKDGKNWAYLKFVENKDARSYYVDFDKKLISYLLEDLTDVAKLGGDPEMLLPETRQAVNDEFLRRWYTISDVFQSVDSMKSTVSVMEGSGVDLAQKLLPFKDVTTNFSEEGFSKELIQKRFSHLTDMRYSPGGFTDENMHAVKMGYWEDVKAERMSTSDISRADKVKEAVNPQIDDRFLNIASNMGGVEGNPEKGLLALDRRLALSSRLAREKVVVGLLRTALIDGTLQGGSAGMTYMTDNPAEGCIAAIFDTLRDESNCLWNHAEGEFCDQ